MLVERTLTSEEIQKRIGKTFVGLASDCDNPEREVEKLMRDNLKDARMLPFVAIITHDGKWVSGWSGSRAMYGVLEEIEKAEKSPHLQASAATRKKMASLLKTARKGLEKQNWGATLKAHQSVAKMWGRCQERDEIAALTDKARAWATDQFERVLAHAKDNEDMVPARKMLSGVKKHFRGEPEADDSSMGNKALAKLVSLRKIEAKGKKRPDLRAKAQKQFAKTRWAVLFDE